MAYRLTARGRAVRDLGHALAWTALLAGFLGLLVLVLAAWFLDLPTTP